MLKRLAPVISALLLVSCISFSGLDPKSNYADIRDATVIVLGVTPKYRVFVTERERRGEQWYRNLGIATLNVYPEDGYVVAKVQASSPEWSFGVNGVLPDGMGGGVFKGCNGAPVMTFDAPSGKVVYVGNVAFVKSGKGFKFETSTDFSAALAHMRTRFPLLADRLIDGGFKTLELRNEHCTTVIPVMIR